MTTTLAAEPAVAPGTPVVIGPADWLSRPRRVAWIVGLAGLALSVVGAFFQPAQFFFSYLASFVFWTGLSLGCMCVLMIHHLTGGGWGYLIRRFLEAAAMVLPVMALLFVPVCLGLSHLYPWMHPEIVAQDLMLQKRHAYLNVPAYAVRSAVAFALWITAAVLLNRWSLAQDHTTDPALTRRLRAFSAPGLLAFVLIGTFTLTDWLMVLERRFYSTVFPAYVMIGWILTAFAFCAVLLAFARARKPWVGWVRVKHFQTLGNFLLAFVMMWAYLAVSQLIIIWSGNLPAEIGWYLHRVAGGWRWVAIFLGLFHFALPFLLLLSREYKQDLRLLRGLAIGILLVHMVEMIWLVEPSLHPAGLHLSWLDPVTLAGVGGVWLAVFFTRLASRPLLPQNDPRMKEALTHGH